MIDRRKTITYLVTIFSTYMLVVLSIQIIAPDEKILPENFPESCPEKSRNCSFIGPESFRSGGLIELRFDTSMENTLLEARKWIESQPRTKILGNWESQNHYVFETQFFRFPDDFVINAHCENEQTVLYVYSESRIGVSDLGVNEDRITEFADYMSEAEMPTSECT